MCKKIFSRILGIVAESRPLIGECPSIDKVIIIGYRATGKSTVGRLLAHRLGWDFVDLDEWIEEKTGKSIKRIVSEKGWGMFREIERSALRKMLDMKGPLVAACGGGAVIHKDIWNASLPDGSMVVWLRARTDTISSRIDSDPLSVSRRPSLVSGKCLMNEIEAVAGEREPLYRKYADLSFDTDAMTPAEIVDLVVERIDSD
ncbi:MAG TPA: shikimate kinase [Thermodesulfobacteriaceae bacterium]|nr:shikimate kinase [Thermodesulfobacteriaceae bacterium]